MPEAVFDRRVYFTDHLSPIIGWPLDHVIALDTARPHFMAQVCRSRPDWRQALCAALAAGIVDQPDAFLSRCGEDATGHTEPWGRCLADLANALLRLEPRELITCAFGSYPDGFCRVIERLGFEPLSPDAYRRLHTIFRDRDRRRQRRVILEIAGFSEDILEAVERLDPVIARYPTMVLRVGTGEAADRFNAVLALVRHFCSAANDEALAKSASDLGERTGRGTWLRNWLMKADQNIPDPPWEGDEVLKPLRSADDLAAAGRRTRTCIETRLPQLLAGRVAYFEAQGDEPVIVAAVRLNDGSWASGRFYGRGNGRVTPARANDLRARLGRAGIRVIAAPDDGGCGAAINDLFDEPFLGEFDFDVLEDRLP